MINSSTEFVAPTCTSEKDSETQDKNNGKETSNITAATLRREDQARELLLNPTCFRKWNKLVRVVVRVLKFTKTSREKYLLKVSEEKR